MRSRREDIPLLIHFHLRQLERETGIPVEGVEPDVAEVLKRYDWPGNVRELRNILEQALYVKLGTTITRNDLPAALSKGATLSTPEAGRSLKAAVRQAEEEAIRAAIREEKGDKQAAALRLGISKSSLYAKVDQYDIRL